MEEESKAIFPIYIRIEIALENCKLDIFKNEPYFRSKITEINGSAKWTHDSRQLLGLRNYHEISILTFSAEDLMSYSEEFKEDVGATASAEWEKFFHSGNPAVETTEGIIHLYKDNESVNLLEDGPRSCVICILSVPCFLNVKDVIIFLSSALDSIKEMKVIRDDTPNRYMILVQFRSQEQADDFYRNYNNTKFNSLETEVCHLCYVSRVEPVKASSGAAFPLNGLVELPNCPVCLERMDESVDGLLTVLCNHTFHGSCISQWSDTSCPVCRFLQSPEPVSEQGCAVCESRDDLWICLICGLVGCGRYGGAHSKAHFLETNHTFALELGASRVWDYAGDNFVHRLVQNNGDGKPVEVEPDKDDKMDAVHLELTYMLTSQLESQRLFYEDKLRAREQELVEKLELAEEQAVETCERAEAAESRASALEKERQALERKFGATQGKLSKAAEELAEEKEFNKCLRENQGEWEKKFAEEKRQWSNQLERRDAELAELREQLRDVMFFVEGRDKLSACADVSQQELADSAVVVKESPPQGAAGRRRRNQAKRK